MLRSSGKSMSNIAKICCRLPAVPHLRPGRRGLLRPFHGLAAGPATAVPSGRRTVPARRSCTYSRSRSSAASLAVLGRRATSSGLPLRDRRSVLELAATRGRVASQLTRDRRRRPADLPRDLPDALAFGAQQRDLLALGKAQVPARVGIAQECRHPATFSEPSAASRLGVVGGVGCRKADRWGLLSVPCGLASRGPTRCPPRCRTRTHLLL